MYVIFVSNSMNVGNDGHTGCSRDFLGHTPIVHGRPTLTTLPLSMQFMANIPAGRYSPGEYVHLGIRTDCKRLCPSKLVQIRRGNLRALGAGRVECSEKCRGRLNSMGAANPGSVEIEQTWAFPNSTDCMTASAVADGQLAICNKKKKFSHGGAMLGWEENPPRR